VQSVVALLTVQINSELWYRLGEVVVEVGDVDLDAAPGAGYVDGVASRVQAAALGVVEGDPAAATHAPLPVWALASACAPLAWHNLNVHVVGFVFVGASCREGVCANLA